ncbi:thioredoxin domain-containing protein [Candidatus Woesearchaeota archaeon]|nr:thioredoxin domain-containing protein [Candidatus Woesearchaeota archaeon]
MICFIALILFGIMGIFSATHRKIALDAFDCVFKRITLRKCTTGLDVKLKSDITSKFLEKSPKLGALVYKHFEVISWGFTILMIGSLIWSGVSAYNYYEYGNCNGPSVDDQRGLCIFDPTGENSQVSNFQQNSCTDSSLVPTELTLKEVNLSLFPAYSPAEVKDQMVYAGCYACPNTRKVNPTINELMSKNMDTVKFVFIHVPLHGDLEYLIKLENCIYAKDKEAYWDFHNQLMQIPLPDINNQSKVLNVLNQISGINAKETLACAETSKAEQLYQAQLMEIRKMNIEGTPTIFVNDQAFIGPKPLRVYERQLSTHTDWFGIGLMALGVAIILTIIYFAVFKREE